MCRNSAKPPSRPMPGNSPLRQCMSSPRAARPAQPAGDERVDDDRVADLDVRHARADLVDPARVLVPGHVGELDAGLLRPLALLDVQVGAAQPGRADLHDHVERPEDLRLVDLLDLQVPRGTRAGARPSCAPSSWSGAVADSQQVPAHAAVGLQATAPSATPSRRKRQVVARHRRPVAGHERRRAVGGVDAQRGAAARARARRPAPRSARPASPSPASARQQPRAWRASSALRWNSARSASSGPSRLARERAVEAARRAPPPR